MITLRRSGERQHLRRGNRESWWTFDPSCRFGPLESLVEVHLPPRTGGKLPRTNAEVLTYVHGGTLLSVDHSGRPAVLCAGGFQRSVSGARGGPSQRNSSRGQWARVFQIWLAMPAALAVDDSQRRFTKAERHGALCVVASPDARDGSLQVGGDVHVYSALLDSGQHLAHELAEGRGAWLQIVAGAVRVGDDVVVAGDGAAFVRERAVSLTCTEDCELLLLDVVLHELTHASHEPRQGDGVAPSL